MTCGQNEIAAFMIAPILLLEGFEGLRDMIAMKQIKPPYSHNARKYYLKKTVNGSFRHWSSINHPD